MAEFTAHLNDDATPRSRLSLTRLTTVLEESGGYRMVIGRTGESVDGVPIYRLQLELPLVDDVGDEESRK